MFVISACYSHIIEEFPSGGGGYLVASKLLGPRVGVVSGCALLVDYALTITTSIAAAGDALFGLLSPDFHARPLFALAVQDRVSNRSPCWRLIVLNLRGIKESVTLLLPIFIVFLITHIILIVGALALNLGNAGAVVDDGRRQAAQRMSTNPEVGLLGDAVRLSARLFDGRRHLHRHRGRFQQHAGDARAARRRRASAPCATWPSRWRSRPAA